MAEYIRIGEPANEAERQGFRLLRDLLPDHYLILGNFDLRLPDRRTSLEYDAVVIGEYGFFAVEIKGWSGLIRGGARHWRLEWGRRSNPLNLLEKKTKALAHFVRDRVDGLPNDCFYAPALLFPCDEVRFDLPDSMMRSVLGPEGIYQYFVDMDLVRKKGPGPFRSKRRGQQIVEAIVAFAEPAEKGVELPYYDVEEELDKPSTPYREYIGSHQYLRSRSKVRIKAYTMDSLASKSRLREEQNQVLRDMEALEVLTDNPYVAHSYEMQPDYEDELIFYLISEWVGPRTLRDWMEEDADDKPTRLALAHHLLEAVATIHEAGIIHRNLSPDVIYLTEGDTKIPLKVADFDCARVTQLESISEALSQLGTNGYRAPELWLDDDYDEGVDIFSAGAILFELLTSQTLFRAPGELLDAEQVWKEQRHRIEEESIRSAIGSMVSPDTDRRSTGLKAARKLFASLASG